MGSSTYLPRCPTPRESAADFARLHGPQAIQTAKIALLGSKMARDMAHWAEVCAILASDDRCTGSEFIAASGLPYDNPVADGESVSEAEKMAQIGRALVLAIAQGAPADPAQAGVPIEVEATLKALMFVAAGIIGQNTNLQTPSEVRHEAERLGRLMLSYAKADRIAGEQGGERLLDILGASMTPEAVSNAPN